MDEVHACYFGPDVLQKRDEITRRSGLIRRRQVQHTRVVQSAHLRIGTKATSCSYDGKGCFNDVLFTGFIYIFNPRYLTFQRRFAQDSNDSGVSADFNT